MTDPVERKQYRVTQESGAKVNGKKIPGEFVTVHRLDYIEGDRNATRASARRDQVHDKVLANFFTLPAAKGWLREQGIDLRQVIWRV